jgi:predicted RNA-binding Zn ribbon-like protein
MRRHVTAQPEDRDGFRFRGGHAALDLTATLAGRLKDQRRDLLAAPADLDRWLAGSGLARKPPGASEGDLEIARTLREAIYTFATADKPSAARDQLNMIAAGRAASPRLIVRGELAREGTAAELLTTLAQQAIELFGSGDVSRLRQCEGGGCALLFLDLSRSGRRRWCSMEGCGNRAKAEAFRRRQT